MLQIYNKKLKNHLSRPWPPVALNAPIIKPVFCRAVSLQGLLFDQKSIGFNSNSSSSTVRCTDLSTKNKGRKCKACDMMSHKASFTINGVTYACCGGDFKYFNVIYLCTCEVCHKNYFGKNITQLFGSTCSLWTWC